MKALIIGTGGQVSTELLRRVPAGVEAVALGRPEIDLKDPAGCAQAVRDADAPAAMARAAADKGLPFLHVSTDYVYDGAGDAPFTPDSSTGPLGAYGRTKLAGDQGVIAAGGRHAILRTSWVFSGHGANFVKTMLRLGRAEAAKRSHTENSEREALNVVSDQIGGPTPTAAIADALWKMAKAFQTGQGQSGIYHFAGAPDVSWAGFAREIFRRADIDCDVRDIPTTDYPTPAQRPLNSRLDCTGLDDTFGIERPDWRDGLADVLKELSHATA